MISHGVRRTSDHNGRLGTANVQSKRASDAQSRRRLILTLDCATFRPTGLVVPICRIDIMPFGLALHCIGSLREGSNLTPCYRGQHFFHEFQAVPLIVRLTGARFSNSDSDRIWLSMLLGWEIYPDAFLCETDLRSPIVVIMIGTRRQSSLCETRK